MTEKDRGVSFDNLTKLQFVATLLLITSFFLPWFKNPILSATGPGISRFLKFISIPGPVDIISRDEQKISVAPALSRGGEGDILALLGRRPCTSEDVADGLGIHVAEAVKHLDRLFSAGKIGTSVTDGRRFYMVPGA